MATGAMTMELFDAGGSGGSCATGGAEFVACGDSKSIAFRLMKNEAASTARPIRLVFRFNVGRINPPSSPGGILQGGRRGR
ncbi:hypothetical protein GCM10007858_44340 [Bradyrhizobium liaoningense]|nr:hypothetical protein GCM10007858_44340 [Bradyrhizobium liaoningense]